MSDIAKITQEIFALNLEQQKLIRELRTKIIIELLFQRESYYICVDNAAGNNECDLQIKDGRLCVFLTKNDVIAFTSGDDSICKSIQRKNLAQIITKANRYDIHTIRFYAKMPLFVDCPVDWVLKSPSVAQADMIQEALPTNAGHLPEDIGLDKVGNNALPDTDNIQEQETYMADAPDTVTSKQFLLVEEIKQFMDTADLSERRKLHPSLAYANPHLAIQEIVYKNQLQPYTIDKELGFSPGFTTFYINDKVSDKLSKKNFVLLLQYFGLDAYAYQYAKYCREIREEIKRNDTLDLFEINPAGVHTKEPFVLDSIYRGKTEEGFFVYSMMFRSKHRNVEILSSTLWGYTLKKEYEIVGLPQMADSPAIQSDTPKKPTKQPRTPDEIMLDSVIGYFKKTYGDTVTEAKRKYEALSRHTDIQREFAKFTQTGRPGKIKVREYSARRLVKELQFQPYDAYVKLCELRDTPVETLGYLNFLKIKVETT